MTTITTSKALTSVYLRLSNQVHDLVDAGEEQRLEQALQQRRDLLVTITNYVEGKQL